MTNTPKSRWFQFSLQTLFTVVTVVGMFCIVSPRLTQEYEQWQRHRRAERVVQQLQLLDPTDVTDNGPSGGPSSVADWERMTNRRGSQANAHPQQDAAKPLGRAEAEAKAKAVEHLLNTTEYRKHQLRAEAFPDGEAWTAYVYYLPETPDFMWTLKVSANGKVIEQ